MVERIRSIHPLAARAEHSRSRRLKRWHLKQPDGTGKGRRAAEAVAVEGVLKKSLT